jgi:cAMP-dependent protein kinase regulator
MTANNNMKCIYNIVSKYASINFDDDKVQVNINKAKVRMSMPRSGVSSEVYGEFNRKENWVPKHIEKNEDQIDRIKIRILQSFLFSNLDANDLQIVIGAMEEKKFRYIHHNSALVKLLLNKVKVVIVYLLLNLVILNALRDLY